MLKKITLAAALTVLATGCATPLQAYLPAGSATTQWQVSGQLVDMAEVRIFINGEKVIDDRLALLSGDGQFHGSYADQQVRANCSSKAGLVAGKTRCAVYVGQRWASTLAL